ncbi:putative low-complexity protein [Xenococcus sp. PCC 7305]|uniref:pentapeptide repeat-containing protein n=1 Tax=Xenococcus sp. PCC 7305 TaxID=102125 RepID=UPI0002ACC396|nr:pentapeptide repeat-containing protein [Xenococcus sp. PCC 7305]ELS02669.1 putative low-complexity protein [Xenococcus sp. PCC 7305]
MNKILQSAIAKRVVSQPKRYQLMLVAATTAMLIIPNVTVSAFEPEDLEQVKTSRVCNEDCDLSNADLQEVYLVKVNLENADLQGANLKEVNLQDALLEKADLGQSNLVGAYLRGATLQEADLSGARLTRADLKDTIFNQANLQGTYLMSANNLTPTQIKSGCNWEEAIYDKNEAANQAFISELQQNTDSNPAEAVDCSMWE